MHEFTHDTYPDMARDHTETHYQYFKRAFTKYQNIRRLLKGIIDETNARSDHKQEGYLRDFSDRSTPKQIRDQNKLTFEYECFYKCLSDE